MAKRLERLISFNNLDKVRIKPIKAIDKRFHNEEGIILRWHLDETYSLYIKSEDKKIVLVADEMELIEKYEGEVWLWVYHMI